MKEITSKEEENSLYKKIGTRRDLSGYYIGPILPLPSQTLKNFHNFSFTTYLALRAFRVGSNKIRVTKL